MPEKVIKRDVVEDVSSSYLDYALDVIIARALPDVRDGMKPVHRRILYAMWENSNTHKNPYKKSARTVGEVLGKYHPHGDSSVYEAMVRFAQDFSLRYPFIDGHGNFGSIDGDPAAAMRYTEARMSAISELMLDDYEKNTVDTMRNYDETLDEPKVLPARLPALLLNGVEGIAVGFASKMPPHNLTEVMNGIIAYIDNPEIDVSGLMEHIKGPDFPGGGLMLGTEGARAMYETGRGDIRVRSKYEVEQAKGGDQIVFTEIPYQVNKSKLVERIEDLIRNDAITGAKKVWDESSTKDGIRIVVRLDKSANSEYVLKKLFKDTDLECNFAANCNAIVPTANGKYVPKLVTLVDMIRYFVDHRKDVIRRKFEFLLAKAEARKNVVDGLIRAISVVDDVVKTIRASKSVAEAKENLIKKFDFNEAQADAILEFRLQKLVSLEIEKYEAEAKELAKNIESYKDVLKDEKSILAEVRRDCEDVLTNYGDERRTEIMFNYKKEKETTVESKLDGVEKQSVVVMITNTGYIKRVPQSAFASQRRGGKGVKGIDNADLDIVSKVIPTDTHQILLCFGSDGRAYKLFVSDIPEGSRTAKGKYINGLVGMSGDTSVVSVESIPASGHTDDDFILFCTRNGGVKKIAVSNLISRLRSVTAITIKNEDDELVSASLVPKEGMAYIATAGGRILCFPHGKVAPHGRSSGTMRGMKLGEGDYVVSAGPYSDSDKILTVVSGGRGKLTLAGDYTVHNRGGGGNTNISMAPKESVVSVLTVGDDNDVMLSMSNGKMIRLPAAQIRTTGRVAKGVNLVKMDDGAEIVSACAVLSEEKDEDEVPSNTESGSEQKTEIVEEKKAEKVEVSEASVAEATSESKEQLSEENSEA